MSLLPVSDIDTGERYRKIVLWWPR